jgi:predicted secreted protein
VQKSWLNVLLVVLSVGLTAVAAEFLVRWLDKGSEIGSAARHLDEIQLAPGVERAWFYETPPPLPNRREVPEEWRALVRDVEKSGVTEGTRQADMFKAWNSAFVGDPCRHAYLCGAPGHLFVYDPPRDANGAGEKRPPYRFLPNATSPQRLTTNDYGFRGPPVPFQRQPRTVRIAFIGASTTVSSHFFPYSYPEFVGNWLNLWAAQRKLDVKFEVLNAGRESITSTDNVNVVREEVMPLKPDLLVYYEGANQFQLSTMMRGLPPKPAGRMLLAESESCPALPPPPAAPASGSGGSGNGAPAATAPAASPGWLARFGQSLVDEFALVRRVRALFAANEMPAGGGEWPKPDYTLAWPAGVDERDPDVGRPDLPINLPTILGDLDAMRSAAQQSGAELVLASFFWLVKDGMALDPIRHRSILEYINQGYAPFRYRDLERMAAFQNRVFAKYAAVHKLDFIDVARYTPFDPDLFVDAIHTTYAGERMRAWVFFQLLVPIVEAHLKSGVWPRKVASSTEPAPVFTPRAITFDCKRS